MKTKDLLTSMDLGTYLREIMKIPLAEDCPAYNRSQHKKRSGAKAASLTRRFGAYRSIYLREKRLRLQVAEYTAHILEDERSDNPCRSAAARREKTQLREMFLELGKLSLRKKELEELCAGIENEFVRSVVIHRYFDSPVRRLPNWSETAKELGIGVTGEELRTYVCAQLSELEKKASGE